MEVHGSQRLIIPNIEVTQRQLIMITKFLHSQYGRLTKNHNTNTQTHTPASTQILLDHAANIGNRCSHTTNTELTAETMTRRSFATNDSHISSVTNQERAPSNIRWLPKRLWYLIRTHVTHIVLSTLKVHQENQTFIEWEFTSYDNQRLHSANLRWLQRNLTQ